MFKLLSLPRGILLFFSLSWLILPLPASAGEESAQESYYKEIPASNLTSLEVETTLGSINIVGEEAENVILKAEISVRGPELETCRKLLKDVVVKLDESKRNLKIQAEMPEKRRYRLNVDWEISAPVGFSIEAGSTNGDIKVQNLNGRAEASTTNGTITCTKISGGVEGRTVNGAVEISETSGAIECSAVNGTIECSVKPSTAEDVELSTINGNLTLTLSEFPDARIAANTVNGKITLKGIEAGQMDKHHRQWTAVIGEGKNKYELSAINGGIEIKVREQH